MKRKPKEGADGLGKDFLARKNWDVGWNKWLFFVQYEDLGFLLDHLKK